MFFNEILIPIFFLFLFFNTAFVIGYFILGKIKARKSDFLFNLTYSLLLGYGILAHLTLLFSYFGILGRPLIYVFILAIFILGWRYLFYLYKNLKASIIRISEFSLTEKILLSIALFLVVFFSLFCFMPPYWTDEVVYHLPEAKAVAENGFLKDSWGKLGQELIQPWVLALPLMMEGLYGLAGVVGGFSLVHLFHYQIFLCLVIASYVFLRKNFSKIQALFFCVGVFALLQLVVNSVLGLVDAAMVAFDITGLFVFINWFFNNKKEDLKLSALLFGFSASIKYVAFYNLLVVLFFLVIKIIFIDKIGIKKSINTVLIFLFFWLLPAGFWYIKNLFFYLNPFYPYFFGHRGMGESEYMVLARETFKSLKISFGLFKNPLYYSSLICLVVLPVFYFIKKNRKIILFLFFYLLTFVGTWFLVGSHVIRYAMNTQVVLIIMGAIILGWVFLKILEKNKKIIILILSSVFIALILFIYYAVNSQKISLDFISFQIGYEYILGEKSKLDFYGFQNLAEEFSISSYINKNLNNEKIINNLCSDQGNFFLKNGNKFTSLNYWQKEDNLDIWNQLSDYLKKNEINYLLVAWREKEENYQYKSGACSPDWRDYKDNILPIENIIREHGQLVYTDLPKGAKLYKIDLQ
jgi:hypothetical protein